MVTVTCIKSTKKWVFRVIFLYIYSVICAAFTLGHWILSVFYLTVNTGIHIDVSQDLSLIWLTCALFLVHKLSVRYYGKDKKELGTALLYLTAVGKLSHSNEFTKINTSIILKRHCAFLMYFFYKGLNCWFYFTGFIFFMQRLEIKSVCLAEISLDVDADRDGVVEKNNPKKVSRCVSRVTAASFYFSLWKKRESEWNNLIWFLPIRDHGNGVRMATEPSS